MTSTSSQPHPQSQSHTKEQPQPPPPTPLIPRAPTDFTKTQSTRPPFIPNKPITLTQSPNPSWSYGSGVPNPSQHTHISIDPYAPTRTPRSNYNLLISSILPRPIGFISTISLSGTKNLAPFSYFQLVEHDPPLFVLGFSSRPGREKDTLTNLKEMGECVINTVSEKMIEAVNATSLDAPVGVSEWDVSGLTERESETVRPGRVGESAVSVEARVVDVKVLDAGEEGMSNAAVVMVKATRFWVREDVWDEKGEEVRLEKVRPVGQLGGMLYARVSEVFEVPRGRWGDIVEGSEVLRGLEEESLRKGQGKGDGEGGEVLGRKDEAEKAGARG